MGNPVLNGAGTWLICTLKQGGQGPGVKTPPGLMDDNMSMAISVDHIVGVTDFIDHNAQGDRGRAGVNVLLSTGVWVTVVGTRAAVATLLGIG